MEMMVTLLLEGEDTVSSLEMLDRAYKMDPPELLYVFASRVEAVKVVQVRESTEIARRRLHSVANDESTLTASFNFEHLCKGNV